MFAFADFNDLGAESVEVARVARCNAPLSITTSDFPSRTGVGDAVLAACFVPSNHY
jgi:hypothetical protein